MFHESSSKRLNVGPTQSSRKAKPNLALEPSKSRLWTRLGREVLRLVWLGASVFLFLALLSYSAKDPSWSTWSSNAQYHNWMGRTGSIVADIMIQSLGAGSLLAVFLMWVLFPHLGDASRPMESCFKRMRIGMAWIFSCSVVFQIFLSKNLCPWDLNHSGGAIGFAIEQGLVFLTGKPGSGLGAIILCAVFSVLFFEREILCTLQAFLKKSTQFLITVFKSSMPWVLATSKKMAQTAYSILQKIQSKTLWKTQKKNEISFTEPMPSFSMPNLTPPVAAAPSMPMAAPIQLPLPIETAPTESNSANEEATEEHPDQEIFKLAAPKVPKPVKDFSASSKSRRKNGPFNLPSLQLLSGRRDNQVKTVDRTWYVEKSQVLVQKLKDFGVDGEVVHISPGPVITVFEFKPASGVKIKEIANLSDDLTLALSVLSVRIVAPIPGKPVVGIEIPTPYRQTVYFKDMLEETPFFNSEMKIPVVLGRLASGEPVVTGLASMPHLLVAGSTGTGKSVFINNLICSLLYRYTPEQLKLILVDPKMVELASYEGIPHLMLPVVVDSRKAALALRWVVDEMERRYALMHQSGVRHVDAYNDKRNAELAKGKPTEAETEESGPLPYIVVVIDEYADLMAVVPKDVELSIARLAQKARASGIHLVLATQRPSTDVVTGTIKANFPSRLSFRVASSIDSKTILDRPGAERLLGNGDMLFHSAGFTTLKRIQGAFLSDADIEGVVEFLKSQGEPEYDERLLKASVEADIDLEGETGVEDASLYDKAVRLVTEKGEASISLIQRHLKIGYNRAASLMEELEKEGVVGGSSGTSKRRQVLVNSL